ncbi:hypothetical protein ASA_3531 [Aeromonas salmonicida subsp. salmonicida A449]|uniref:Uncharacterized protein n=1 Tax=Aeromonas salmonicida (strain A449) TaxID=382245 RepID=A4SRH7_AERS4|nr:hypothetical protein ASA_3531 [Aeromonas salmonicida subsp. salmonicida A449]
MAEQGRRVSPPLPAPAPGQRASEPVSQAVHNDDMASKEKPRSGASCFLPATFFTRHRFCPPTRLPANTFYPATQWSHFPLAAPTGRDLLIA